MRIYNVHTHSLNHHVYYTHTMLLALQAHQASRPGSLDRSLRSINLQNAPTTRFLLREWLQLLVLITAVEHRAQDLVAGR